MRVLLRRRPGTARAEPPPAAPAVDPKGPTRRVVGDEPSRVDLWFNRLTLGSGLVVLLLLVLVGLFLFLRSQDALSQSGWWGFLTRQQWRTDVNPPRIGVMGLLSGTILVALIAISIALPLGVVAALFITEYSSRRTRAYLTALVDLLAAVPSLLFGIWGFLYLSGQIVPLSEWLSRHFGWIPLFSTGKDARAARAGGPIVRLQQVAVEGALLPDPEGAGPRSRYGGPGPARQQRGGGAGQWLRRPVRPHRPPEEGQPHPGHDRPGPVGVRGGDGAASRSHSRGSSVEKFYAPTVVSQLTLVASASWSPWNKSRAVVVVAPLLGTAFAPTPQGGRSDAESGFAGEAGASAAVVLAMLLYGAALGASVLLYQRFRPATAYVLAIGPVVASTIIAAETQTQSNVAPSGPLTGLRNGDVVTVTVTGPAGSVRGVDARQCRPGVEINSVSRFNPSTAGNCIGAPLTATTDDFVHVDPDASNTAATLEYRVGIRSNVVTFLGATAGSDRPGDSSAVPCRHSAQPLTGLSLGEQSDKVLDPGVAAFGEAFADRSFDDGGGKAVAPVTTVQRSDDLGHLGLDVVIQGHGSTPSQWAHLKP